MAEKGGVTRFWIDSSVQSVLDAMDVAYVGTDGTPIYN